MTKMDKRVLPDVASTERAGVRLPLDWVGMSGIALPFTLMDSQLGEVACQGAAQLYVNICRPDIKGIHMSRLYLLLDEMADNGALTPRGVADFLRQKVASHHDISDQACFSLTFDFYSRRPALKSRYQGWKAYPVTLAARLENQQLVTELQLTIPYSSTCPCSASLSRQLLAREFEREFGGQAALSPADVSHWLSSEKGSYATPHSQRSYAYIKLKLADADSFAISAWIDRIEEVLQTPVQTAVKREDEQEFARLNGHNLMFVEDAARRIKAELMADVGLEDFWLKVEHLESLHAHDAVAIATKGVAGGYPAALHW